MIRVNVSMRFGEMEGKGRADKLAKKAVIEGKTQQFARDMAFASVIQNETWRIWKKEWVESTDDKLKEIKTSINK